MRLSHQSLLLAASLIAGGVGATAYFASSNMIAGGVCVLVTGIILCVYLMQIYRFLRCLEAKVQEIARQSETIPDLIRGVQVEQQLNQVLDSYKSAIEREFVEQDVHRQAELNALQSQINPHFLYNTLDSIRGQALMEGVDEIADMTEALSTFFRYSISNTGVLVSVADELENAQNYLAIQQYRFGDRIGMQLEISAESLRGCGLPKMTLQPIIENAVYHGLETILRQGIIQITISSADSRLYVSVRDNGVGMEDDVLRALNQRLSCIPEIRQNEVQGQPRHSGIALVNVSQRIKILFGEEYGLHIYSTRDIGTEVIVELPLLPEYAEWGKSE